MATERIVLDGSDFRSLVSGGEVKTVFGTRIILSDIGYDRMLDILSTAKANGIVPRKEQKAEP